VMLSAGRSGRWAARGADWEAVRAATLSSAQVQTSIAGNIRFVRRIADLNSLFLAES